MEIYDIFIHFFSFPLFFSSFLSCAHILYIMCTRFFLPHFPSFFLFRYSSVYQRFDVLSPEFSKKSPFLILHIRKKCVPLHSLSGMTRGLTRKRSLKGLGYKTNTRRNIEASAGPFFSDVPRQPGQEQIKNIIQCRV